RRRRHEQRAASTRVERSGELTAEELFAVLDAELAKLPDKWRLPLVLCCLEGRTQDEAAKQLGWGKSTLEHQAEASVTIIIPLANGQRLLQQLPRRAVPPLLVRDASQTVK